MLSEFIGYGLNAIYAIIILIAGWLISGYARTYLRKLLKLSDKIDATVVSFASNIIRYLILIVVGIAVLQLFGIETTSLVAVLGASTLAIGLALQGTLSNVAAGVLLLIFRPFKVDDYITVGGYSGTVSEISLFTTELVTPQNVLIILPNSDTWGTPIENHTAKQTRRLDLTVGIGYEDDINHAIEIFQTVIKEDERIHDDPEPFVKVANLGDSSVEIVTRVWCNTEEVWNLKFDLLKKLKESLDKGGISIPYPQIDVHQK